MFSDILLTVDFDRTLTAPDTTIPQRNLEAIAWFMDNGGTFTVNTGRSVPMTRPFLDQISVNAPLLLYNGSAAYDPATGEISQPAIIAADMWQLIEKLQEKFPQFVVEVQGVDAHYCTSEDQAWAALSQHNRCAWGFAKPGQDLGPFLKLAIYGEIRDVTIAICLKELRKKNRKWTMSRSGSKRHLETRYRCSVRLPEFWICMHRRFPKAGQPGICRSVWGKSTWSAWETARMMCPCWMKRTSPIALPMVWWQTDMRPFVPVQRALWQM